MKYFAFVVIFAGAVLFTRTPLFAQETPLPLDSIVKIVEGELQAMQTQLDASDNYESEGMKKAYIEFALDTARIELLLLRKGDFGGETYGTTLGIVLALQEAESDYDKLLNKYYQALSKKLTEEDRKTLKEAQTAWIKFRDNELALDQMLADEKYSGGGSIQRIFHTSYKMQIVKQRVIELFEHYASTISD